MSIKQLPNPGKATVPAYWLAFVVFIVAITLGGIIPPVQSPDENSHLARAYLLSKGQFLLEESPDGSGGAIDVGLLQFTDSYHEVGSGKKLDSALVSGIAPFLRWTGVESFRNCAGTGYYFPLIYAPQAIALALGRHLDLTIQHSYQLSRIFVLVSAGLLVVAACVVVTPSFLLAALLAMPMVVFQAISATIDAVSVGLCMLAASCFLSLLRNDNGGGVQRRFVVLCIAVFVLAGSRAHSMPLVLLPFVVAWHRRSRGMFAAGAAVLLAVFAWTALVLLTVHDDRIPRSISTGAILHHYAQHPATFVRMVAETVKVNWGFYRDSFIGKLGYLDVHLPAAYERFAGILLPILALLSFKITAYRSEAVGRSTLAIAAIGSAVLIFVAMVATWTPFPSELIDGVQGRYFHIPAILLAYAIAGDGGPQSGLMRRSGAVVFALFAAASVYVTSNAVLDRYWLIDRNYSVASASASQRLPLVMNENDSLKAEYLPPATGKLYSLAVSLGTYYGKSSGVLHLEICAQQCRIATIDVGQATDNLFSSFWFDTPLEVQKGVPLRLDISLRGSRHGVALWSSRTTGMAATVLNGRGIDLLPIFRPAIQ